MKNRKQHSLFAARSSLFFETDRSLIQHSHDHRCSRDLFTRQPARFILVIISLVIAFGKCSLREIYVVAAYLTLRFPRARKKKEI